MNDIPIHVSPNYSKEAAADALFHYTTGNGLIGILRDGNLWSTAYYCTNDESELNAGRDVLRPTFTSVNSRLIQSGDERPRIFASRGVNISDYAYGFEQTIISVALSAICVYVTCFCKAADEQDFTHGLLSQWRGYGSDGGYALQFSRKKLQAQINSIQNEHIGYALQDVYYSTENPLKEKVAKHADAFSKGYLEYLDSLAEFRIDRREVQNPTATLTDGPLETLFDYFIHTKNRHFGEERECRMSLRRPVSAAKQNQPVVDYLNRNGLIVPFVRTPPAFDVLQCIDWIIVGPGNRLRNRVTAVQQMVRQRGLNIQVRPSHIPFSRD